MLPVHQIVQNHATKYVKIFVRQQNTLKIISFWKLVYKKKSELQSNETKTNLELCSDLDKLSFSLIKMYDSK